MYILINKIIYWIISKFWFCFHYITRYRRLSYFRMCWSARTYNTISNRIFLFVRVFATPSDQQQPPHSSNTTKKRTTVAIYTKKTIIIHITGTRFCLYTLVWSAKETGKHTWTSEVEPSRQTNIFLHSIWLPFVVCNTDETCIKTSYTSFRSFVRWIYIAACTQIRTAYYDTSAFYNYMIIFVHRARI